KVPAYLNVVDIAGLVKGAAEGQGLGNAFLSHINACDSIFHLCRAFEDTDVTHVEGEVDPVRDLSIISEELRLKDEEKLMINLDKMEKLVTRGGDKKSKPEYVSVSGRFYIIPQLVRYKLGAFCLPSLTPSSMSCVRRYFAPAEKVITSKV
uniref:OBG-type G domain-containing protein n=1 Tax=Anopheles christyi TaxID=43041 RepID=A0A182KF75_9DIPT